jgi:branched-chain amino acid aminotransferase
MSPRSFAMTNPTRDAFKKLLSKDLVPQAQRRTPPSVSDPVPFGRIPTDHIFICDFLPEKGGWQAPQIVPYQNFQFSPIAVVFHYGQEIFEGLKAYRDEKDANRFFLFRHDRNAQRMYNSALRLGMEPVPTELFMFAVEELVKTDFNWILQPPSSLYIRPTLIPLDEGVSYRASTAYRFFVCLSPAKNYYSKETGVSVYIEREIVRACPGGSGEAKCGGNYAAALPGLNKAKKLGAEQVLWLDAFEHKYAEEVGAMNIMFVYEDAIITPALTGSILPGITRASIIELARSLGYTLREERVDVDQVVRDAKSGRLKEVFGCGTAAVISPVDAFIDGETIVPINNRQIGEVSTRLKNALTDIQFGRAADPFGWRKSFTL